jgi:hypothetical protein
MASVGDVKEKVQRILSNALGSVRIDKDGDFVTSYESAVVFIEVRKFLEDRVRVTFRAPLVKDVQTTPELYKWVATKGQEYFFGTCRVTVPDGQTLGWVFMEHTILGDDLDESELINALTLVTIASDGLDNQIRDQFGGELFGNDES